MEGLSFLCVSPSMTGQDGMLGRSDVIQPRNIGSCPIELTVCFSAIRKKTKEKGGITLALTFSYEFLPKCCS